MIGISKLLCGHDTPADVLRYGRSSRSLPAEYQRFSEDKKPVVVWNSTRQCNLHCVHCYISATRERHPDEFTTAQAEAFIDDLAGFGAPVLLFSGGEPLMREDLFHLGRYAVDRGLRAVISTNGTLINKPAAAKIKAAGFSYVGISLDGAEATNDLFRGQKGAFQETLTGMHNCREAGVKTGLRFTINKRNQQDLGEILDLLGEEQIPRCCVYHLVYAGRGTKLMQEDLDHRETRAAVDLIFEKARGYADKGMPQEILTVDNHTDGVYLYRTLERENPERAKAVYELLLWNGGNSTGMGIGCVDYLGEVHADQFWGHHSFGNVRRRPFSEIWTDTSDPIMAGLKNRKPLLKGRCAQGACKYLEICNGNFRVRAEAVYDDIWAHDPACYLSAQEIGLSEETQAAIPDCW